MLKPFDHLCKFLVLEASEKATYDTVVAIGPVQVMGLPAFLEGNHWLMGKLRSKILTENKGYYIGKCYLEKGKQMLFYFGEVFIFKILQVLKKVLLLTLGFIAPEG